MAKRGEPFELVAYPGAYHDFDNPALVRSRVRMDVPNGAHPRAAVTVAPDAEARNDVKRRVLESRRPP